MPAKCGKRPKDASRGLLPRTVDELVASYIMKRASEGVSFEKSPHTTGKPDRPSEPTH